METSTAGLSNVVKVMARGQIMQRPGDCAKNLEFYSWNNGKPLKCYNQVFEMVCKKLFCCRGQSLEEAMGTQV